MKKNLALRLGAVVLVMSVITLSLVSGTFAKYTRGVTGSETIRAAKFAFDLYDGTGHFTETQTEEAAFNIFHYTDDGVYGNGTNTTEFIAPGTTGTFSLDVSNLSEVDVGVTFGLAENNADNIPVYYTIGAAPQRYSAKLTGEYEAGISYLNLNALATALAATGTNIQATDGTTPIKNTYTLNWFWSYNPAAGTGQTDSGDTTIGIDYASPPTVELECTVTVTQADA
jgi:hypothetical protein